MANARAENEYRLVTDGRDLYRIESCFTVPEGLTEIIEFKNTGVFDKDGRLIDKFANLQIVKPRLAVKKLVIAVRKALGITK